jgi:hypothetical protein
MAFARDAATIFVEIRGAARNADSGRREDNYGVSKRKHPLRDTPPIVKIRFARAGFSMAELAQFNPIVGG